jgi:hypothetical protein
MKKIYNLIMMSFLMLGLAGFALAVPNENGAKVVQYGNPEVIAINAGEETNLQNQVRAKVMNGEYSVTSGLRVKVQEKANDRIELGTGNSKADTGLKINAAAAGNATVLSTQLSNGRNAEIKVMPNTASEKALERLQLKNCVAEDGCSMELKEVGVGEGAKLAYEVKTQKNARIFGLFATRMNVEAQVNAETGEVIRTRKPWWSFLASEPEEKTVAEDEAIVAIGIEEPEVEEVETVVENPEVA